ncbi:LOW QUALITY PROTEIN: RBBP8 N-terminal-like protein [Scomber scombrus]|uniref:LOW QUALITY PROTEIN: RBBP8 N-terminal-like protein n=1 Tax=Scomber scombrus TaxID=13677 RepID=A0AAV1PHK7_SCOSC
MEFPSFSDLLPKLREAHEREVDGWQAKVHELSNKKGCDTKRMEELFNRNQQMKEQQRLLTDNIKTLENRLRAGLCDRCTVTQEVAKRRQQEFELSQMQSLQHITMLAGEVSSLKKENRRLREEIGTLKAARDKGKSRHSPISNITITEVKQNFSPDLSPSCNPLALMAQTTSWATGRPADGDVAVKTEVEQKTEEAKNEHRQLRGVINHFEVCQPMSISTPPSWKAEHSAASVGDRRSQSMEGPDQRSSIPGQALPFKNSSSSTSGEANPSRHVLHAPVPCRPQPIKSSPVTLPWPLSESSDWMSMAAAGTGMLVQPSPKLNRLRFPNLIPTSQHASHTSSRRQGSGSHWHKQSKTQPHANEPTVLFRLRDMSENVGSQTKPKEKKEIPPSKAEGISGEGLRETYEGPLDLSDRGKSNSGQTPKDDSPLVREILLRKSPDNVKTKPPPPYVPVSSPSPATTRSTYSTSPLRQEKEPSNGQNHKVISKQEKKEDVNGKTDQNNVKKVPVLTISLRPVVVLEALNTALQKQESLSANGKKLSPAAESGSSSYEQDEEEDESGQDSNRGYKRKRASVETETDRDSDTNNIHPGGRSRSQ